MPTGAGYESKQSDSVCLISKLRYCLALRFQSWERRSNDGRNDESGARSLAEVLSFHSMTLPVVSNILNKF